MEHSWAAAGGAAVVAAVPVDPARPSPPGDQWEGQAGSFQGAARGQKALFWLGKMFFPCLSDCEGS